MQSRRHLFTSESVAVGHPDKAADQAADAILDALLTDDPLARVACEVMLTDGLAVIAGEITSDAEVYYPDVLRDTMRSIGYLSPEVGFDADAAEVIVAVQQQSPDIARGVREGDDLGAGDQGLMFGYAIDETPELMPLPITLAHRMIATHYDVRRAGTVPHLGPDAKCQVSIVYEGTTPVAVESAVLSSQHGPEWSARQGELAEAVTAAIIRPSLAEWWDDSIQVLVNPTGHFLKGGPAGDTGLTGRKLIVDTYGGWGRHGGGSFSGKDPSKVDRSASYMARHVAKNVVAAGLARECEVRLGYVIGRPDPTAVTVDCLGTETVPEEAIEAAVRDLFPFTPSGIIEYLDLRRPIYRPTSYHGHFGRTPDEAAGTFTWERTDKASALRDAVGATVGA